MLLSAQVSAIIFSGIRFCGTHSFWYLQHSDPSVGIKASRQCHYISISSSLTPVGRKVQKCTIFYRNGTRSIEIAVDSFHGIDIYRYWHYLQELGKWLCLLFNFIAKAYHSHNTHLHNDRSPGGQECNSLYLINDLIIQCI